MLAQLHQRVVGVAHRLDGHARPRPPVGVRLATSRPGRGGRGDRRRSGTAARARPATAGPPPTRDRPAPRSRAGSRPRTPRGRSRPAARASSSRTAAREHARHPVGARAAPVVGRRGGDEVPGAGLEHQAERVEHPLADRPVGPLVADLEPALRSRPPRRPARGTAGRRSRAASPARRGGTGRGCGPPARGTPAAAAASSLSWVAASTLPRPRSAAAPGRPVRNIASASSAVMPVSRVR